MLFTSLALHAVLLVIVKWKKIDDFQQATDVHIQLLVHTSATPPATTLPTQNVHSQSHEQPTPADPLIVSHSQSLPTLKKVATYKTRIPVRKDDTKPKANKIANNIANKIAKQHDFEKKKTKSISFSTTAQTADQTQNSKTQPPIEVSATGGMDEYMQSVLLKIERKKHYPIRARTRHLEGRTVIGFNLLANGTIEPPKVVDPSGYELLDQSALQAVTSAAPFGRTPEDFSGIAIPLEVVLVFQFQ